MTLIHLLAALAISASTPADDPLTGRFTLNVASSDDPAVAVDEVVSNVGRMGRGRARSRLTPMMAPAETLEIGWDGEAYLIVPAGDHRLRLIPGADAIEIEGRDGERARMSAQREGESLHLRMEASSATRTQRITPTENGLEVTVVWDLEIAREPVTLVFHYDREREG